MHRLSRREGQHRRHSGLFGSANVKMHGLCTLKFLWHVVSIRPCAILSTDGAGSRCKSLSANECLHVHRQQACYCCLHTSSVRGVRTHATRHHEVHSANERSSAVVCCWLAERQHCTQQVLPYYNRSQCASSGLVYCSDSVRQQVFRSRWRARIRSIQYHAQKAMMSSCALSINGIACLLQGDMALTRDPLRNRSCEVCCCISLSGQRVHSS